MLRPCAIRFRLGCTLIHQNYSGEESSHGDQGREIPARAHAAVNYRLRTIAGGRLASRCRPTSIAILLTERCNARCVHCDIWKNRGKEDSPTVDQWKTTLRDLRRWLGPVTSSSRAARPC